MKYIRTRVLAVVVALSLTPALAFAQDDAPAADAGAVTAPVTKATDAAPAPAASPTEPAEPKTEPVAEEVGQDPIGTLTQLVQAVRDGNWKGAAAALIILLVWAGRKFGEKWSFFRSDRGGPVLVFALSFGTALIASGLATEPMSLKLFITAAEVGLMAMGGFVGLKRVIWPKDNSAT